MFSIVITSLLIIRRRFYETFLVIHKVLAVVIVARV